MGTTQTDEFCFPGCIQFLFVSCNLFSCQKERGDNHIHRESDDHRPVRNGHETLSAYPLCVIAPFIGAPSETFIRRHMNDILPGKTVVIATSHLPKGQKFWGVNGPILQLRTFKSQIVKSLLDSISSLIGGRGFDYETFRVRQFLKKYKVRVIHSEYLDLSMKWLPIARNLGIPFYAKSNGFDASQRLLESNWKNKYLELNFSDGVLAPSQAIRAKLLEIGIAAEKIFVIPYGVDVPDEFIVREPAKSVRLISVGRMVPKKGPILMLEAFRRAVETHPDMKLDFFGAGELMDKARQFVGDFKLEERVLFHGFRPSAEIYNALSRADIYVQHSIRDPITGNEEGLPVAILEAMAMGLPVVSTRHAGIPEAVMDGKTGYLVEEGDAEGMAARMIELAVDGEKRVRMGRAGWERAKRSFSWEQERSRLIEVMSLSEYVQ